MAHRNIKLTLQFDGTDYHGWQIQKEHPTVQGKVTGVLSAELGEDVKLTGCSRTDAGVHARRYYANFTTHSDIPVSALPAVLNAQLPDAIAVLSADEAAEDFNARFDVQGKWYRYTILCASVRQPLHHRYVWQMPRTLDPAAIRSGAEALIGSHDFTAMCGKIDEDKDPVRELTAVDLTVEGELLHLDVRGRSFLYRMVRIIAGTLADVGSGSLAPGDVARILASRDRDQARAAAPARGLTLMDVSYGE